MTCDDVSFFFFFFFNIYILKQLHKKNILCLVGKRNDNDAFVSLGNQAWTSCTTSFIV